jgi:hypothetical protein
VKSIAALLRRPDIAIFTVGLVLFAGGLTTIIRAQLRPPASSRALEEAVPSAEAKPERVGPDVGADVAPYLQRKRTLLSERASREGREPTFGIVVFNSYRKASEVEALMKSRNLQVHSIQTRVPLATFKPKDIALNGRSLGDAAREERSAVNDDLETLESIVADAVDDNFRMVYEENLRLHQEALGHLNDDPAIVFAAVVKGTNSTLRGVSSAAQVRYVDIPDDPTATPDDTVFAALIPEDTKTATFAVG